MTAPHDPAVSVIVPVHDDRDGLVATLDALGRVRPPAGGMEIVVSDDRSTEDLSPAVAGRTGVRLVRNEGGRGSYGARNAGVRASVGTILAFTDADCEPDEGWLEAIVRELDADPSVVVAGRIRMPLPPRPTLAAMVDVTLHLDQERCIEREGYAVTANIACTRATFDAVGPFSEELQSSGDKEWTMRAGRAGHELRYVADASIAHAPRSEAGQLWRKSKRVGLGLSAVRTQIPADHRPPPPYWPPGWIRPRHRQRGLARVRDNGGRPDALRWLLAGVAQVAYVQFPQAWFAFRSDVLASLRRRARRS